jgi:hypothetical protein
MFMEGTEDVPSSARLKKIMEKQTTTTEFYP